MAIPVNSGCMTENDIVSNNVRLSGRVAFTAIAKGLRASSWREESIVVSKCSYHSWLVKRLPVLHSVTKHLETEFCIISKIFPASKNTNKDTIIGNYTKPTQINK